MKERVMIVLCGFALIAGAASAQVVVRVGPPPAAIVERPGRPLHPGWVWVGGAYRWDGARYVWVPGRWVHPPRPRAVWVPGGWVPRGGGYVFIGGGWR